VGLLAAVIRDVIMKSLSFRLRNIKQREQALLYAEGEKAHHTHPLSSNPYIGIHARIWTAGWKGKKLAPKNLVNIEDQPLLTINTGRKDM